VQPFVGRAARASPREVRLRRARSSLVFLDVDIGPFHAGRLVVKITDACPSYCGFLGDVCAGRWGNFSDHQAVPICSPGTTSNPGPHFKWEEHDGVLVVPGFKRFDVYRGGGGSDSLSGDANHAIFSFSGFARRQEWCGCNPTVVLHKPGEEWKAEAEWRGPWQAAHHMPQGARTRCGAEPAGIVDPRPGTVFLDLQHCGTGGRGPTGWLGTHWDMHVIADRLGTDDQQRALQQLQHAHPIGVVVEGLDLLMSVRREQTHGIMENLPFYCNVPGSPFGVSQHGRSTPFCNRNMVKVVNWGVL